MLEKQFDEMLEDIESANDEFVNDYFSNMDELVFNDDDIDAMECVSYFVKGVDDNLPPCPSRIAGKPYSVSD